MKKGNRGGMRKPENGEQNAKPVRTGTKDFSRTAKKSHAKNLLTRVPMRGGIRL